MITFGNFINKFSEYRAQSDMADMATNSAKYMWELPQEALDSWKTSIDEYQEKFTQEELDNFHNMFEVGQKIVNIPICALSKDMYARLYRLTEYDLSFTIPDVLCSVDYNITEDSQYTRDIILPSGNKAEISNLILPKSLVFTGTFDGCDNISTAPYGLIRGQGFANLQREHNRLEDNSLFGFVNYKTGDIHLVRSSLANEVKFEKYYDKLVLLLAGSGSSASGSSGSGNSSLSQPEPIPDPYDYLNITGSLKIMNTPIEVVLEVDIDQDPL